jgi:hypothetical protein
MSWPLAVALLGGDTLPALPPEAGLLLVLGAGLALGASLGPAEPPPPEEVTTAAIFALHGHV